MERHCQERKRRKTEMKLESYTAKRAIDMTEAEQRGGETTTDRVQWSNA